MLKALAFTTWFALVAALGLGVGAVLRLVSAGNGPKTAGPVDFGSPSQLPIGQIKTTRNVALGRDAQGYYALNLTCPHLGCHPTWHQAKQRFLCPCHGSAFTPDGARLSGPAPRGLAQIALELNPQGQLIALPSHPMAQGARLKV